MKKIYVLICVLVLGMLSGCSRNVEENFVEDLGKKIEDIEEYEVTLSMEISNNGSTMSYDMVVSYLQPEYYKVAITNLENNTTQIIVKNQEGVFVLTPSLNKSFQFQSEWPLNTSHAYLYQSLVKDIVNEEDTNIVVGEDTVTIESGVSYRRDSTLTHQKIVFDKKSKMPREVVVYDETMTPRITVDFHSFNLKPKLSVDDFSNQSTLETAVLEMGEGSNNYDYHFIYPSYIPMGSYLVDEVETSNNMIMSFSGSIAFTVVEEVVSSSYTVSNEVVYGDPVVLDYSVASLSNGSITWMLNGVKYTVFSDDLSNDELVKVANSVYETNEK